MMKKLSQEAFQNAKSFIMEQGRALDQQLFAYHFEGGVQAEVIEALSHYQNDDGGFGQALEPDLRTPLSSVYTTSQGLHILREVGAISADKIVQAAISYLINTYDSEQEMWHIIPVAALEAPHAGHWDFIIGEGFAEFFVVLRAGLAGHLSHYADIVPSKFPAKVSGAVLEHLLNTPDENLNWIYLIWSYLGLLEGQALPEPQRNQILQKLRRSVPHHIKKNTEEWTIHGFSPINLAPSPAGPLAEIIDQKMLNDNLDYDIESQLPDGTWALDWSWGNKKQWAQVEREWKAHLAISKLQSLRAYGRIEGI